MMTTFLAHKYAFMLCYYAISIQRNSYAEHYLKMKRLVDFSKGWLIFAESALEQVQRTGTDNGLGAAGYLEFAENIVEVLFHGADGDDQLIGNFAVGEASVY